MPRIPACLRPAPPTATSCSTDCRSPGCERTPTESGWCRHHLDLFEQVRADIQMDFRHGCPRRMVGRDRHTRRITAAAAKAAA